jgi:hypothetical protein
MRLLFRWREVPEYDSTELVEVRHHGLEAHVTSALRSALSRRQRLKTKNKKVFAT